MFLSAHKCILQGHIFQQSNNFDVVQLYYAVLCIIHVHNTFSLADFDQWGAFNENILYSTFALHFRSSPIKDNLWQEDHGMHLSMEEHQFPSMILMKRMMLMLSTIINMLSTNSYKTYDIFMFVRKKGIGVQISQIFCA